MPQVSKATVSASRSGFAYHKTLIVMLLMMGFTCAFLSKISSRISIRTGIELRRRTQVIVRGSTDAPESGSESGSGSGSTLKHLESKLEGEHAAQSSTVGSIHSGKTKPHVFDTWKEPGQRYIVYQPSGGFTNQRILLEKALYLANRYGATLILPPVCKHTSFYKQYNLQPLTNCSDMLDVFDETLMQEFAEVKSIAQYFTLEEFVQRYSEFVFGDWINLPTLERKIPMTVMDKLFEYGHVLYLSTKTLWNYVRLTGKMRALAFKFVRYKPELLHLGQIVATELFQGNAYAAIHIRFREAKQFTGSGLGDARSFLTRIDAAGGKKQFRNLYVATVPNKKDKPYFRPFKTSSYNVVFSDSIIHIPEVEAYMRNVPRAMRESTLGIIESLVCSRSTKFLGTGYSSFSKYIRSMRAHRTQIVDTTLLSENTTVTSPTGINSQVVISEITSLLSNRPDPVVETELKLLRYDFSRSTRVCGQVNKTKDSIKETLGTLHMQLQTRSLDSQHNRHEREQ